MFAILQTAFKNPCLLAIFCCILIQLSIQPVSKWSNLQCRKWLGAGHETGLAITWSNDGLYFYHCFQPEIYKIRRFCLLLIHLLKLLSIKCGEKAACQMLTKTLIFTYTSLTLHELNIFVLWFIHIYICLFSDINECLEEVTICAFRCQNTRGSYRCVCPKGYQLASDGNHCVGGYDAWRLDLFIISSM